MMENFSYWNHIKFSLLSLLPKIPSRSHPPHSWQDTQWQILQWCRHLLILICHSRLLGIFHCCCLTYGPTPRCRCSALTLFFVAKLIWEIEFLISFEYVFPSQQLSHFHLSQENVHALMYEVDINMAAFFMLEIQHKNGNK